MKEQLQTVGVNYDEVLKRFMGKEDFYRRMLKKFLDDENYEGLRQSVEEKRWSDAFKYAHTVKGLCGNLGLDGILEYAVPLTDEVRAEPYDEEKIGSYMEQVTQMYEKTRNVIESL